jgi:hypothetical protein
LEKRHLSKGIERAEFVCPHVLLKFNVAGFMYDGNPHDFFRRVSLKPASDVVAKGASLAGLQGDPDLELRRVTPWPDKMAVSR